MSITQIICNEWVLDRNGRLIPIIHFTPVTVNGKIFGQVPGYSYWFVMERGLGVGATIFIDVRKPGRTAYISHVNVPTIPNLVMFCECGKLFKTEGRHFICKEPAKKCLRRGIHAWLNEEPINWFHASVDYPSDIFTYLRDNPDYFRPRSAD